MHLSPVPMQFKFQCARTMTYREVMSTRQKQSQCKTMAWKLTGKSLLNTNKKLKRHLDHLELVSIYISLGDVLI